jgi:GNAT superfamily N-acetyltransferase
MQNIKYQINSPVSVDAFINLLHTSTLGLRRPVDDQECLAGMLANSNLIISAWFEDKLIGIARSITDFHYACYLSDLAVDSSYQKLGVGKEMQALTQAQLGKKCKLILIAAPDAHSYYEQLGFTNNERCWVLNRDQNIKGVA